MTFGHFKLSSLKSNPELLASMELLNYGCCLEVICWTLPSRWTLATLHFSSWEDLVQLYLSLLQASLFLFDSPFLPPWISLLSLLPPLTLTLSRSWQLVLGWSLSLSLPTSWMEGAEMPCLQLVSNKELWMFWECHFRFPFSTQKNYDYANDGMMTLMMMMVSIINLMKTDPSSLWKVGEVIALGAGLGGL